MKFSHNLKLKKDLPTYKTGWPFRWSGSRELYFPNKPSNRGYGDDGKPDIYLDYEHQGFTVEQGQDSEWFEPVSEPVDFIPTFPRLEEIEEYVYLSPETRLVSDVDFCRCFDKLVADKGFKERLYEFYREEYETKFDLRKDAQEN